MQFCVKNCSPFPGITRYVGKILKIILSKMIAEFLSNIVWVGQKERERERETERQTDRQTVRQRFWGACYLTRRLNEN